MKKIGIAFLVIFLLGLIAYIYLGIKLDKIAIENIPQNIPDTVFNTTSERFNLLYWEHYTGTVKPRMDNQGVINYLIYFFYEVYFDKANKNRNISYTIVNQVAENLIISKNKKPTKYEYGWTITWYAVARWISHKWTIEKCLNYLSNELYFGNGKFGIKDAAKYYCKKDINKLSDEEMKKLIKITISPSRFKNIFEK